MPCAGLPSSGLYFLYVRAQDSPIPLPDPPPEKHPPLSLYPLLLQSHNRPTFSQLFYFPSQN